VLLRLTPAMRLLVVVALLLPVAFALNTCLRPESGNFFTGVYPLNGQLSPILRNIFANVTVAVAFDTTTSITEAAGSMAIFSVTWDMSNLVLDVKDNGVLNYTLTDLTPYTCDVSGKYQINWNSGCTQFTLDVVQDECYARRVRYNGLTLKRVVKPCTMLNRRVALYNSAYATYNPGNLLSGLPVQFIVRPGHSERDILEQSVIGTRRSNWKLDKEGHLLVYDVSSRPKLLTCGDVADAGIYLVNWADDCNSFKLTLVSDSCRGRREIYHEMTVKSGGTDIPRSYNSAGVVVPSVITLFLSALALALF